LLFLVEAGLPLPVPADFLMIAVGERAAAGALPLWLAVVGLELAAIVGTAALFAAARGPAQAAVSRVGPRVGLTPARLATAGSLIERRGLWALLAGRATPGLRTATVLAAAASPLAARRALPPLIAGSSLFLQAHVLIGFAVGPVAEQLLLRSAPLLTAIVVLLAAAGLGYWLLRRRRAGPRSWSEATCPACLAAAALLDR
jgi:membrane protein DedA with SNARE-associated domain